MLQLSRHDASYTTACVQARQGNRSDAQTRAHTLAGSLQGCRANVDPLSGIINEPSHIGLYAVDARREVNTAAAKGAPSFSFALPTFFSRRWLFISFSIFFFFFWYLDFLPPSGRGRSGERSKDPLVAPLPPAVVIRRSLRDDREHTGGALSGRGSRAISRGMCINESLQKGSSRKLYVYIRLCRDGGYASSVLDTVNTKWDL